MLANYTFLKLKFQRNFILLFVFAFSLVIANAQESYNKKDIDASYKRYTEPLREVVYVHLNKSVYIKGEDIGFNAYVLDKNTKKLSQKTTNLYCVLSDKNNKVIKKQLVRVKNGIANGLLKLDSLFTSGDYTFKAYTNWMRNFKEHNFFLESIRVIDPNAETYIEDTFTNTKIDAQFLPESGHLLHQAVNTVGVILKNNLGFGIPDATGEIFDENNTLITTFKVNHLGIGRFSFLPLADKKYKVKINAQNISSTFDFLEKVSPRGIILSLKVQDDRVLSSILTNKETLPSIHKKNYTLVIHNGNHLKSIPITFNKKIAITKQIEIKNLFAGMNIFTLFDEKNNPIAERLFFNYEGISFLKSSNILAKKESDSIAIKLSYQNIDNSKFNSISVSVLPEGTSSYQHQHNLVSYTFLRPYMNGVIENGSYYFSNINERKKYELDNLLITQGWSSYDWSTIFSNNSNTNYIFEQGITFKANAPEKEETSYLVHSVAGQDLEYFKLSEKHDAFVKYNTFPAGEETVNISQIDKRGKLSGKGLYLQFFPGNIPLIDFPEKMLNHRPLSFKYPEVKSDHWFLKTSSSKVQKLDEVVVKANLKKTRIEKLKSSSFGRIDVLNDNDRISGMTLANYITNRGFSFTAYDNANGEFVLRNRRPTTINSGATPLIFLNGFRIFNTQALYRFPLTEIDYIEMNPSGVGQGLGASAGYIKVYTNPLLNKRGSGKETLKSFKFPVTFTPSKRYYAPLYNDYNSSFYKKYGTIDWLPVNTTKNDGDFHLKIHPKNGVNTVLLFIEGIANDGDFIHETRKVSID